MDGLAISIPVHSQHSFAFTTDSLTKGFYELEEIGTVYLSPGYQLMIAPAIKGSYVFTGTGAIENNALRSAKTKLSSLLPVGKDGALTQAAYFLDVPVFLEKMDSLQQNGERLFKNSSDTFFTKYAGLDLSFYIKSLLSTYFIYYGKDMAKMNALPDSIRKLDSKAPDYLVKLQLLMNSVNVKKMSNSDMLKFGGLIYNGWDRKNEMLFRNSTWYRMAFKNFFASMLYNAKYFQPVKIEDIKLVDSDIKTLAIAKGELTNSYILSYFDYTLTIAILKQAKDTATLNKYYKEYITRASRSDYLNEVKTIYDNAVSYTDNTPAPPFSYTDIWGKPVSLESLKGKYVYIDVWATWCGPCKAEIPHLKKVEAFYADKNIQFVSISVDEQQHKAKWKEYVTKNKLGGIQLITDAAFETSFIKRMSINSIPRFILIDPAGKIVSADALRPSNEKLKTMLSELLQ